MQALPKESKTKRKGKNLPISKKVAEKLMKLNFNLLLITFEYLKKINLIQLLKVNKRFNRIIKEKTDVDFKFKQFKELSCHCPDHCTRACGKRVHRNLCLKNFDKFFQEDNLTRNNLNNKENLPVLCFNCEKPYCKKCAKVDFVKCSGPLTRFINNHYQVDQSGNFHPYTPTCKSQYCTNCVEKIIKCDKCLKFYCTTCTFSAQCRVCPKKICAECCFKDFKYKEAKSGSITCKDCDYSSSPGIY